ncbi:MAG TPA: bifunctional DNA-binding transcriptional regulator/O6-methylguanine-DNA methyltransferase Ada [Candidatus Eremiobacteraceae bacterium]|nr:bifunctional DNA-binding transcriptional regulator/O6-methylguanine-DNA methyltransferase Ada [Candidatus Eremiobacteraceae bacterium]
MSMVETDARWQAFMARDKNADGRFVVGVHSTKIYCRPSCPARHPKPQNVTFFPSAGEARARGYRACLRCQPDQPAAKSRELVQRVCRYIDEHDEATPDLRTLGRHAGVSPSHLQRVFKALIGITPKEYSVARRMQRLKQRLKKGEAVTSALYAAGFGSSSRLYENGDAHLGMTPGRYRRAGTGSRLHYTTVDTMLGRMLVACTPRGVSEVRFGESDAALEKALRQDYHRAEIARDDAALQAVVKKIVAHLDSGASLDGIALDVRATAFQHRVWKALRAIPYGQTRTYGEIAAVIREPKAARAVGRACGSNPVAVIVPCHRVVCQDPNGGGYRWGMRRKRRLLAQEQRLKPTR